MAASQEAIGEIIAAYAAGDSVGDIAKAHGLTSPSIVYHLKKAGVYAQKIPTDADHPSDEDLGIGQELPPEVTVDTLLANPAFAALLDAAVSAKMQAMGVSAPAPDKRDSDVALEAFMSRFDHMLEVQAEQRPGYIKPLSAHEIDRRRAGQAEMRQLLIDFKARGVWPHYYLTESFHGPSPNGPVLYEPGQEIKTHLPPAEGFRPLNEPAAQVYAAYKKQVGEVATIEDLIAQALVDARGGERVPEVANEPERAPSDVMLVDAPKRDVGTTRVLGTLVPERLGSRVPGLAHAGATPSGPFEVG